MGSQRCSLLRGSFKRKFSEHTSHSLDASVHLHRAKDGNGPTQRSWVWASPGRHWRTGKPGVLQSTGSQRVGRDWATEPQSQKASKIWWRPTLITLSVPEVSNHPLVASKCTCTMLCLLSWKVAVGARLEGAKKFPGVKGRVYEWRSRVTVSSNF